MSRDEGYKFIFTFFLLFIFLLILFFNFSVKSEQQFSYLAKSFLDGKLYFIQKPLTWADTSFYNGEHYWPLGPLPAMLLMPFVYIFNLLNKFFYQGYLQFFLVLGVFFIIYKISRTIRYQKTDSLVWAMAFVFGSTFLGVGLWPWSWQFSQVVTEVLLVLAIYEYLTKKRYFLIGCLFSLVALTRLTALVGIVFFILEILIVSKQAREDKVKNLFKLLVLPVLAAVVFGFYNYFRFGSFLDQGYFNQTLTNSDLINARNIGFFNLVHLPKNLYFLLFSLPFSLTFPYLKANPWGISIWITSPYLLYLFFLKFKDTTSKVLILTVLLVSLPIILFYGIGYRQFGYRYALDFFPFLFLLFIRNYLVKFKKITIFTKYIIVFSTIFNFYLFSTVF